MQLSETQRAIRDTFRRFMTTELDPLTEKMESGDIEHRIKTIENWAQHWRATTASAGAFYEYRNRLQNRLKGIRLGTYRVATVGR